MSRCGHDHDKSIEVLSESPKLPSVSSEALLKSSGAPIGSDEVTLESTKVPPSSSDVPSVSSEVPTESSEVPLKSSEDPYGSSEVQNESSDSPPESSGVQSRSSEVPLKSSEVPNESTKVPSESSKVQFESSEVRLESSNDPQPESSQTTDFTKKNRNRKKRRRSPASVESERLEKLARKEIEKAMTAVVVRQCWSCHRRFIKTQGCDVVQCVCGAMTCYRCGERISGNTHRCQRVLPRASPRLIRQAAENVKQHLRLIHPGIKFKYDPSRKRRRRRR